MSKKKIRADFRKNRAPRSRDNDFTQSYGSDADESQQDSISRERVSGKGELTRKRTVVGVETNREHSGFDVLPKVNLEECRRGQVLAVYGLQCRVYDEATGEIVLCATRRLLKTLSTDQRHVVAAGDQVYYRATSPSEGLIERVEPRRGALTRTSKGRRHVLVANVDQLVIIGSAAEPRLKPNLIDRFLVTAEKAGIEPLICINKIDLVDPAELMPIVGQYSQMGYRTLLTSATHGVGVARLRAAVQGRQSAVTGQSGVGKSSLLNCIEPDLGLRVAAVSAENQKGKHTTTTAQLIRLQSGGFLVDTPGVRQFQLWDVIPEEVAGYYRDLRPFVSQCRYPDCAHDHEDGCAVKDAVADHLLDARRYESYLHLHSGGWE